ncbi:IQ and ubiquitin-like domain-containing protein [Fopius arisanus]|uniref:IQ and ubiquitin-like domain-containing protein n=1 Tax=Fopius arisanus TaxID=64838 RepID=A0A9R1SWT7_9HYME|nr:PREDICTED: IQ and ubiquitin-like domain-containing protein [Fopius arisanus]
MSLTVKVSDRRMAKPYLGGWRHRITGVIYLNAACQTGPPSRSNFESLRSRSVQCIDTRYATAQSNTDVSTQMWRPDCYVPCLHDRYIVARPYESYENMMRRIDYDGKARIIQKCYRGWKMLKNIKECTEEYRRIVGNCKKFEEEKDELHRKRHRIEILRQLYPKNRSDFDKIYSLIEGWKNSQLNFIKINYFQASLKAEHSRVLERTVEMLKSVEKQRKSILERHREEKLCNFLNFHCKPVKWTGYKGKPIEMITLRTQKAREYKFFYDNLCRSDITLEERMEILISLNCSLESHKCAASRSLRDLIKQEISLASRNIKELLLDNLKKRISLSFLCFIRNCHFCCVDDEQLRDLELSEPKVAEKILCRSCMRLLPCTRFMAHVRMKKLSCCVGCHWLRQHSVEKVDYDPYTYLLNGIRADEHRRNCFSMLLYVIQEPGIYHLVCNIWHGRSIVSEVDDIFRLRLVRFNVHKEWAPWNCILLTEEESEAHYFIDNLSTVYSKILLDRVNLAHEIAKTHFEDLTKFEQQFRMSERFRNIQDSIIF